MAYERYDRGSGDDRWRGSDRHGSRDRFESEGRHSGHREGGYRGGRDERGFFERAGEEIASWFGGSDDDHRSGSGHRRPMGGHPDYDRDQDREGWFSGRGGGERSFGSRDRGEDAFDRGANRNRPSWHSSGDDYNPSQRREMWGGGDRSRSQGGGRDEGRGYRPMTGDYGRSEGMFAASGYGFGSHERDHQRGSDFSRNRGEWAHDEDGGQSKWDRDEYRRTSFAGSTARSNHNDPHYDEWRRRQMDELDRDYQEYRREHQSRFESDFGNWRERRQSKRQMLGTAREHMEVVGKDEKHVGTVDKIAGDRIILTKSDPEAGGVHHSLSCTDIDRIEGDRIILDIDADEARRRWRDEDRGRALFERDDRGEDGPHMLDRSFSGTYR